jgi:hypothetical protein
MTIPIGTTVRVWDDDRGRWWWGELTGIDPDGLTVTIADGDHPIHPWEAFTLVVPVDPELLQVHPRSTTTGTLS